MSETFTLPDLQLALYRFDLEAVDALELPAYKGSTLRGGFGYAFKKMVCKQADWRGCNPCKGGNSCPYGFIFETSMPADIQGFSSQADMSPPFVIEPPFDQSTYYSPGSLLTFQLLLAGKVINYLPHFLLAFQELGRAGLGHLQGRCSLKRILSIHPWHSTHELVFDGVDVYVSKRDLSITMQDVQQRAKSLPPNELTLNFFTPTRLKYNEELVERPPFHVIVRALLRRITALAYFHTGQVWHTDFPAWVAAAEGVKLLSARTHWRKRIRFSTRQQQGISISGMVGKITYRGNLEPFLPLLAVGELVHIGKSAVFGNGRYQIERDV